MSFTITFGWALVGQIVVYGFLALVALTFVQMLMLSDEKLSDVVKWRWQEFWCARGKHKWQRRHDTRHGVEIEYDWCKNCYREKALDT